MFLGHAAKHLAHRLDGRRLVARRRRREPDRRLGASGPSERSTMSSRTFASASVGISVTPTPAATRPCLPSHWADSKQIFGSKPAAWRRGAAAPAHAASRPSIQTSSTSRRSARGRPSRADGRAGPRGAAGRPSGARARARRQLGQPVALATIAMSSSPEASRSMSSLESASSSRSSTSGCASSNARTASGISVALAVAGAPMCRRPPSSWASASSWLSAAVRRSRITSAWPTSGSPAWVRRTPRADARPGAALPRSPAWRSGAPPAGWVDASASAAAEGPCAATCAQDPQASDVEHARSVSEEYVTEVVCTCTSRRPGCWPSTLTRSSPRALVKEFQRERTHARPASRAKRARPISDHRAMSPRGRRRHHAPSWPTA